MCTERVDHNGYVCIICLSFTFTRYYLFNNADLVDISCETRKKKDHELMTLDNSGSPVTESDVIVVNPFDDSVCHLQCAVGWYDAQFGSAAPFSCAPKTADRTLKEGTPTYPIKCKREWLRPRDYGACHIACI